MLAGAGALPVVAAPVTLAPEDSHATWDAVAERLSPGDDDIENLRPEASWPTTAKRLRGVAAHLVDVRDLMHTGDWYHAYAAGNRKCISEYL